MGVLKKIAEKGLEAVAKKAPRMSKAELEAKGYYHPIGGGLKLSKPAQEFTADIVEDPNMPLVSKIPRSPEELYGKVGIPFVGDRSQTGKLLRGIEDVTFDEPIKLEGGHKFGRAHQYQDPSVSSVWASDPDVVTSLLNQIRRAGESGKDILGISSMGSPKMVDFNTMIAKSTLNMTDVNSLSREAIEEFNNELRNKVVKNKKTGKVTTPFKDFLGIDHPEVADQLLSQEKGTGELRKAFINIMDKDKYRKLGFPEIAPIRKAVTDPEILDMPLGSTGLEIYKMSPEGKIVESPKNPHSTYPVHMQGEYFGGLEVPIDYKNMFSTFYEPKRLFGVKDPQAYRAYSLSAPIQEFNQQWLDEVMPIYQQKIKDITGRKKGGEIHPDGSPRLANGASARKMVQYILKNEKDYAGGGFAKKIAKKLAKEATEDFKFPPKENTKLTQIVGTTPTYEKARDILGAEGIKGADIIDFGAGKGLGSTMMKAHSYEPYPQGWYPTYTNPEDIPSDAYKGLLNLNVLNVLDPESRAEAVKHIGRVMQPEGGVGLITTRGRDVLNTIKGKAGPEPMSVVTSRNTYQKGFEPEELRNYIKYILGSDFEYEPLDLGQAGVKIKKKADGGTITTPEIEVTPDEKIETLKEIPRGKISGKIADILKPASEFLGKYQVLPQVPLLGGTSVAELTGVEGLQTLAEDISKGYRPIRNLERGKLQTSYFDPRILDAVDLGTTALGGVGLAKNLGKTAIKEGIRQIQTGEGMLGRNVINPRMNIIKDPGGMLVGGEKALDDELRNIKHVETPGATFESLRTGTAQKDPNAVALNNWIDTKVRKYIRNQAGSKDDPILKTVESGVDYNFTPPLEDGQTRQAIEAKREMFGKPKKGISATEKGKDWEYTVDSIFNPQMSRNVKAVLNRYELPHTNQEANDKFTSSLLRTEHDLPVYTKQDLENLKLIHNIPDETIYSLNPEITNRLGLNHMSDVLMEDLNAGRLRPEQLNQMSIEKAVRRVAEYDAQKAKEMAKAEADRLQGLPVHNSYGDGNRWIELGHPTDPKITEEALESESKQMGHCVGTHKEEYLRGVLNGTKRIYSLRDSKNVPHVTIEETIHRNPDAFIKANADTIANDPDLKKIQFTDDLDYRDYERRHTDQELNDEFVGELISTMKKKGLPIKEDPTTTYSTFKQVKGKSNQRPLDKYQDYISDFIKNPPIEHELVDVRELYHTNLMNVQNVFDNGIVPKDIHFHPEVEKALTAKFPSNLSPSYKNSTAGEKDEMTYDLFREVAEDLARQGKTFIDKNDILNHIREKYLLPKKKSGGSINLNQEYKLENLRRRYG